MDILCVILCVFSVCLFAMLSLGKTEKYSIMSTEY